MRLMGIEGISQLEQWHKEEVDYFSKLGWEPEWDVCQGTFISSIYLSFSFTTFLSLSIDMQYILSWICHYVISG